MRAARGIATAVAVAALLAGSPAAAGAGGDPPPATAAGSEPRFELAAMDRAWLAPGDTAVVELAIDNAEAATEIAVIAHQRIDAHTTFERILDGAGLGSTVPGGAIGYSLAELPLGPDGTRVLSLGLQDPALPRDPARLPLTQTNVYPLEFELRDDDGNVLTGFVLPLVVAAPNADGTPIVAEKLRVTWVWPLVAAPAREPFGEPDPAVVEQLGPDGRIGRQATALAAAPDLAFTVAPGPETLEAWTEMAVDDDDLAAGLDAMQAALATNQILAGPYVPVNIPSLVAGGLAPQVGAELAHGTEVLGGLLATRLDPRTLLVDPVSDDALVPLRDVLVDRMIVNGEALVPIDSQFTPAQPFALESQGRTVDAVATHPGLSAPLTAAGSPALRAQQFLAGLAVVALEQPNARRGIVIANPADWDAPAALLDAAVTGLRGHPLLVPADVDQLLAQVPATTDDGDPLVRDLEPYVPPPPPVTAPAYREAQAELASLRSLIGGDDLRVAQGDRALLVSLSSAYEGPAGRERARRTLSVIGLSTNELLSQIRVPVGSTITLTARKGEIPVTFLNETDLTLRVRVRLESDRLFFPDGAVREVVLPPRNTTIGFAVESRTSGTFPLELTVTSLDDGLVIQSTRVRVRSTFVSGVGVFLTVGAALFLAGWWLLHFRGRRRRRRPPPDPLA